MKTLRRAISVAVLAGLLLVLAGVASTAQSEARGYARHGFDLFWFVHGRNSDGWKEPTTVLTWLALGLVAVPAVLLDAAFMRWPKGRGRIVLGALAVLVAVMATGAAVIAQVVYLVEVPRSSHFEAFAQFNGVISCLSDGDVRAFRQTGEGVTGPELAAFLLSLALPFASAVGGRLGDLSRGKKMVHGAATGLVALAAVFLTTTMHWEHDDFAPASERAVRRLIVFGLVGLFVPLMFEGVEGLAGPDETEAPGPPRK